MKSTTKKLLLYIPITALGVWCAWLQDRVLTSGFDARGLLVTDNPELVLLWGLTAGLFLALVPVVLTLGAPGTYEENFPRCVLSGTVTIAAGLLMGFTGLNGLVPGQLLRPCLTMAAGVLMALCGVCRLAGRRPVFVLDLLIGLYYAAHLLWSYSGWNADPQIQRYAFQLLAGAAVMLFTIHRARCAVGMMDRRRMVFLGLWGIFLCFAAIPGSDSVTFFLASGLWCAGAMGDLRHLEQPVRPEPPEAGEA